MTRVVWVVMVGLALALGIPAAVLTSSDESKMVTFPQQRGARAVIVPSETTHRIIVPPCGTGTPVASTPADALAKTPGSVTFVLKGGVATQPRVVLIPRCRAAQGAAPSEGVHLPAAAFVLPVEADVDAGRGGSREAGTELVEGQLQVPPGGKVTNVVVPGCLESEEQLKKHAPGRLVLLKAQRRQPDTVIGAPC